MPLDLARAGPKMSGAMVSLSDFEDRSKSARARLDQLKEGL